MINLTSNSQVLEVPRGELNAPPLPLDMSVLYRAESRLQEVTVSNMATVAELRSVFNEANYVGNKYIAWIKNEIMTAKRNFDLSKAEVLVDKLPLEIKKLKESGLKDNADFRAALVDRDESCRKLREILDGLEAVKMLLEAKVKSFDRAYWDTKEHMKRLESLSGNVPNLSTPSVGISDSDIMSGGIIGTTKY